MGDYTARLSIIDITGTRAGANTFVEACTDHIALFDKHLGGRRVTDKDRKECLVYPRRDLKDVIAASVRKRVDIEFGKFASVSGTSLVKRYTSFIAVQAKASTINNDQSTRSQVFIEIVRCRLRYRLK